MLISCKIETEKKEARTFTIIRCTVVIWEYFSSILFLVITGPFVYEEHIIRIKYLYIIMPTFYADNIRVKYFEPESIYSI